MSMDNVVIYIYLRYILSYMIHTPTATACAVSHYNIVAKSVE